MNVSTRCFCPIFSLHVDHKVYLILFLCGTFLLLNSQMLTVLSNRVLMYAWNCVVLFCLNLTVELMGKARALIMLGQHSNTEPYG